MMAVKELFPGVYTIDGKLATINLVPGRKVYGEELVRLGGKEYRLWNPYRSKLAAAIIKGLKEFRIREDSKILYIGAATGTTASHVSDIAKNGAVYCIELSERNMKDLLHICESRPNMLPILADARFPDKYADLIEECDIIYQDAAAREQAELINLNLRFLQNKGCAYFIIKSQSVDVSKKPEQVFKEELSKLDPSLKVGEKIDLEPYDELHLFSVLTKS